MQRVTDSDEDLSSSQEEEKPVGDPREAEVIAEAEASED
jgi:hypothetical protein